MVELYVRQIADRGSNVDTVIYVEADSKALHAPSKPSSFSFASIPRTYPGDAAQEDADFSTEFR
ncbi:hypothetical protein BAUCODRAFT_475270 [Baudoinia panamericana UAMH 10762]|uniref:Uncharacterized protein n=1 Tax=Baudoinia panamericana (strain UAMH 10762) TaxID=717646 RepID=M2NBC2_BAUPA|nr:uncharacterized protein BAUCODRAFT_475270 [Baudoinia panamericana UAMH 10762]EMC96449.1 hypothetical protein BAUCODRAFT_475270 [Baudoinia panamericana UAMH 10762]